MQSEFYQEYSTRPARGFHFHLLARGSSNPKMAKLADRLDVLPFNLSLAPYTASGAGNVCPCASKGCSAVCLHYAGKAQVFGHIHKARIAKTRFWFADREGFLRLLALDLAKVERLARKNGKRAVVRLNVFSDIPWERFLNLDRFPDVQFYDYTKIPKRLGRTPDNYYLTFSRSETNEPESKRALAGGFNVAVPFRERPKRFWGFPVIDGDKHDYRFLDPQPAVVGLKPKGYAVEDTSGFVCEDCAIYTRVSPDQPAESQLAELRRYARDHGWDVFREYVDHGPGWDNRPALDALMADARKGSFDVVLVRRLDRFARSGKLLIAALEQFQNLGIVLVSVREDLAIGGQLGRAVLAVVSAMARLERQIRSERIKAGIRRAIERGKRPGRPRVKVDREQLRELRSQGLSVRKIAGHLGISKSTVAVLLKELE